MNNFYKQPFFLQWLEAVLLLAITAYPVFIILELVQAHTLYALLFFLYLPVFQFGSTPILKLTKMYHYYSPMLFGYMPSDVQIDLHSGGGFDYLFVMRKYKFGIDTRNRLLAYHLEGLLAIIAQIETGILPKTVIVSGTSYFFNERTIQRLGFEYKIPSLFHRINLLANFLELTVMYSCAKGMFSIPNVLKARKASIEGGALLEKKEMFSALYKKLALKSFK